MRVRNLSLVAAAVAASLTSLVAADRSWAAAGIEALQQYAEGLSGERREAADFLLEYLPEIDRENLSVELFRENLDEAYFARENYPWTRDLPKELFFNDVCPHAIVSESRDPYRKQLREALHPHLVGAKTLREAVAAVGNNIVELTDVHYNITREKACQSPAESIRQGKASCTGLSILMVDSLRAAGVPSRLAAIALWGTLEGNHTWIEVHDGTAWRKIGWGEGPDKWDSGWEIPRSAYCDPREPLHGIFASTYRRTDVEFPMIWEWKIRGRRGREFSTDGLYVQERDDAGNLTHLDWKVQPIWVSGIDRTPHYLKLAGGRKEPIPEGSACVTVKAYGVGSEQRVATPVRILQGDEVLFEGKTAHERQDLNDYVRVVCAPGELRVEHQDASGAWVGRDVTCQADEVTPVRVEI